MTSSVSSGDSGRSGATFALRVPTRRLDDALARLSKLAHVRSRTQNSQDVTGAFVSAQERLDGSLAERKGLLRQLARADTPNETASIRERLRLVQSEIATARAQVRGLRTRTDFSAVSVTIEPGDSSGGIGAGGDDGALDPPRCARRRGPRPRGVRRRRRGRRRGPGPVRPARARGPASPLAACAAGGASRRSRPADREAFPRKHRLLLFSARDTTGLRSVDPTRSIRAELPSTGLELPALEREITELSAHIQAATCRWLGTGRGVRPARGLGRLRLPFVRRVADVAVRAGAERGARRPGARACPRGAPAGGAAT